MLAINFQVQESIHANGWESLRYGLVNFKCLMTNHATFDTQLDHVSASRVHAEMQATVVIVPLCYLMIYPRLKSFTCKIFCNRDLTHL